MGGSLSLDAALQVAIALAGALGMLWLRHTGSRLDSLEKDHADFRERVAREYVTRSDISSHNTTVLERLREIREHVTRVEDKLDHKQDKSNGR